MSERELAEEHAVWTSEFFRWVYVQAWKHAWKHCLEEIKQMWDNTNSEKDFGELLQEKLEKKKL